MMKILRKALSLLYYIIVKYEYRKICEEFGNQSFSDPSCTNCKHMKECIEFGKAFNNDKPE